MFKGSIVALITPFKNNKLDEDCYISLIHHHLKNGTTGIVPAGTTGESPTLSHDEHERVIELCVKESNGKIEDFILESKKEYILKGEKIKIINHGSGCNYSASITASLAMKRSINMLQFKQKSMLFNLLKTRKN